MNNEETSIPEDLIKLLDSADLWEDGCSLDEILLRLCVDESTLKNLLVTYRDFIRVILACQNLPEPQIRVLRLLI